MSDYFKVTPDKSELCGRCTAERLTGCGDGRGFPECMESRGARIVAHGKLDEPMRTFSTGATRNVDENKPDPDGFISPLVLQRYCEYMHAHRVQADGSLRASDNWQKGIPVDAYRKSLNRHHLHAWLLGRGYEAHDSDSGEPVDVQTALCAIIFNASGWLHEDLTRSGDVLS